MRPQLAVCATSSLLSLLLAWGTWQELGPGPSRSIRGVVRDANREPIAGARVLVEGEGLRETFAWTDDDGTFLFEGVRMPVGAVGVDVTAPGLGCAHDRLWQMNDELFEPSRVAIDAEGDAVVDLRVWGFLALAGEVRGELDGEAFVDVLLWDDFPWRRVPVRDGRFRVTGLVPLRYLLRLEDRSGTRALQRVELGASRDDVLLAVSEPWTVTGRVDVQEGLGRANVSLRHEDDLSCVATGCSLGADGSFRLETLLAGTYRLVLSAREERAWPASPTRTLTLRLGDDEPSIEGLRLPLTGDAPVAFRVEPERELQPCRGTLHARHASGLETEPEELEILVEGDQPLFRTGRQQLGPRLMPLSLPTGAGWTAVVRLEGYETIQVPLAPFGEREIRLPLREDGSVRVRASLPNDAGEFEIDVLSTDRSSERRAELYGRWSVWTSDVRRSTSLPPGEYRFRLRSANRVEQELGPMRLWSGDPPLELRFDPKPGLTMSGEVRDHDEPFACGILHLWRWEGGEWRPLPEKSTALGQSGCIAVPPDWSCAFRFGGLTPGRYAISFGSDRSGVLAELDLESSVEGLVLSPRP